MEENVTAHFSGKVSIDFFHLRLNQRVTGTRHHADAAAGFDVRTNVASAFDVMNNNCAGFMSKNVAGKEHCLTVRENDFTVLSHNTQAVTVAVIGNTDFGIAFAELPLCLPNFPVWRDPDDDSGSVRPHS